ncbi:LysR substrate-binding domain-containing protein [Aurantimonas sp.]|uniref:LysR substrate-binding domain-containing protein n=3 Tax=Aurantimonas TaxID=182269 RepID=UPI003518D64C
MHGRSPRLPPLNGLRAFAVAARHGNFRLAAEELGVSQGAVAQQVRGLEAELGLSLFDRLPRGLALTDQGRAYAAQLGRAFELMADATAALKSAPRHLTISVTPTFAAKWLIPRLPDFAVAHPDIELRISASDRLANFQSDGVDLAVRQGRPPFGPGLRADPLFAQEIVAVCAPALATALAASSGAVPFDGVVLLDDAHDLWPQFAETILQTRLPDTTRHLRFNQTALAIDAAIAGQGVALASRFLVAQDLTAGRLVLAVPQSLRGDSDFHAVTPRARQPAAVEEVRAWLLRQRAV